MITISVLLAVIFGTLAVLHVYWSVGGSWGSRVALPTKPDGSVLFEPGITACLIVAFGLNAIAYLCLVQGGLVATLWSPKGTRLALAAVSVMFFLRTVGDRRYVGVTRTIKDTRFARYDRAFYTPLCGLLCVLTAMLYWLSKPV